MKIQHYAIIFLFIIVPFSIVCRSAINKKVLNLKDETRYNNIIDNAVYDAVGKIHDAAGIESSAGTIYGKNVPITYKVADEAIGTFFNTLCVDFNLPQDRKVAEGYFDQYIPAIMIVGYDGLYVYSIEKVENYGYKFVLKPKIPYSSTINLGSGKKAVINYTLDNYVTIYFTNSDGSEVGPTVFAEGFTPADGGKIRQIRGYVGTYLDNNGDGVNDFTQYSETGYDYLINPYRLNNYTGTYGGPETVEDFLSTIVANNGPEATKQSDLKGGSLSYFLFEWARSGSAIAKKLGFLFADKDTPDPLTEEQLQGKSPLPILVPNNISGLDPLMGEFANIDFTNVNKDYEFDNNVITGRASIFHQLRRYTIIDTITSVMREEFNEHNEYAKMVGVTYEFNIPRISNDQWNNTIDDVSVLAFMQGMPMGGDLYYNNYSLGGARIIQATNMFCEYVNSTGSGYGDNHVYAVYHRPTCSCLPRYGDRKPAYCSATVREAIMAISNKEDSGSYSGIPAFWGDGGKEWYTQDYRLLDPGQVTVGTYPDNTTQYKSTGIVNEYISEQDAAAAGFYPCSVCM